MRLFSITIPVAYVTQFSDNVHMLSEQRTSRLRGAVMMETDVTGESFNVERIGQTNTSRGTGSSTDPFVANPVNDLHGDTPLDNTPHTRRRGFISTYDCADLIDRQSKVRLLIDPQSRYTVRHSGIMGRTIDQIILAAAGGSVAEGHDGTTITAYDTSNQQIASGSVGMTVAKLRNAKRILDENEVDEMWPRYCILRAQQVDELLEDDKIASQDYNTVKALVDGKINTFLGFTFIRTELVPLVGSDIGVFCWASPGIRLALPQPPSSSVDKRPDKRNAMQIYTDMSAGAVRAEDEMVVRILCAAS